MSIGWYNGWSQEARLATLPVQREALRDGRLARPTCCSICRSTINVWLHNERYDLPLEVYAICRHCHRSLHERFEAPEPWRALVARHGTGMAWFEQLSLNPAIQEQPFAVSYPDGLPPPV